MKTLPNTDYAQERLVTKFKILVSSVAEIFLDSSLNSPGITVTLFLFENVDKQRLKCSMLNGSEDYSTVPLPT
jgi:hypothetical protein